VGFEPTTCGLQIHVAGIIAVPRNKLPQPDIVLHRAIWVLHMRALREWSILPGDREKEAIRGPNRHP
jgi:hypothetical protein